MNTPTRSGQFSSSSIYKLVKEGRGKADPFSAAGLTYIHEKRRERKLGRCLQQEKNPRSASWGRFLQKIVFNDPRIGTAYRGNASERRTVHPTLPWSGAEDFLHDGAVGDFKCFELDNFTWTHDAASVSWAKLKKDCPDIVWQLVSGAVLHNLNKCELILYVPYLTDLELIIQEARELDDKRYNWMTFAEENELPYLLPDTHYPDLSKFVFEIPEVDKAYLIGRVEKATELLNQK
jgi:hypothetical protein